MKTDPKLILVFVAMVVVAIGIFYVWPFENNTDKYIAPEPAVLKLSEARKARDVHRQMRLATFNNIHRLPEERIVQLPPILDNSNSRLAIVKFMSGIEKSADVLSRIPITPDFVPSGNEKEDEERFNKWQVLATANNPLIVQGHAEAGKAEAQAWRDIEESFGDEKSSKLPAFKSWWQELEHSKLLEQATYLSDDARARAAAALTKEQDKIKNNEIVNIDQATKDLSPDFGFDGEFDSYIWYTLSNTQPPGKLRLRPPLQ